MADLSRRQFLAAASGLAAAWGLSRDMLGGALAAPARPTDAGTTLRETIRLSGGAGPYRTLVTGPGESYIVRFDLIGRSRTATGEARRRSLAYLGHMSDIHIMDAQSPARLEPLQQMSPTLWQGACRPQDTLTVHVQAQMVAAMSAARYSPLTGAPMAAMFNTGDSADMHSVNELRWYIDAMDGGSVIANSGAAGVYEGPQVWSEADYAYHPDDPGGDRFGAYGFPTIPGMLTAAVSQPVQSQGMPVPWYAVYGNHDALYYGTFPIDAGLRGLAVGARKPVLQSALGTGYLDGWASDSTAFGRLRHMLTQQFGGRMGWMDVTPDGGRELFRQAQFMSEHFTTAPTPGPVGHGFTQENLDTGKTYWSADVGPHLRLYGLDTCNQVMGADGAVPQEQFDWLRAELARDRDSGRLAVILSHHNSKTLENGALPAFGSDQRLIHSDEFVAALLEFPNVVAWCNGHTHINTITAHPRKGGGGFWEITTASCIDFPQQQQTIEVVDNRDGTLSLFTTVLDHDSPARWRNGDLSQKGLASLSRELAANDWVADPLLRIGSPLDRNCELLLPAPFDLSTITDAALAREDAGRKARLVAYEQGRRS